MTWMAVTGTIKLWPAGKDTSGIMSASLHTRINPATTVQCGKSEQENSDFSD